MAAPTSELEQDMQKLLTLIHDAEESIEQLELCINHPNTSDEEAEAFEKDLAKERRSAVTNAVKEMAQINRRIKLKPDNFFQCNFSLFEETRRELEEDFSHFMKSQGHFVSKPAQDGFKALHTISKEVSLDVLMRTKKALGERNKEVRKLEKTVDKLRQRIAELEDEPRKRMRQTPPPETPATPPPGDNAVPATPPPETPSGDNAVPATPPPETPATPPPETDEMFDFAE